MHDVMLETQEKLGIGAFRETCLFAAGGKAFLFTLPVVHLKSHYARPSNVMFTS